MDRPKSDITLAVEGMTCAHCEIIVERVLRGQPGVHHVHARYRRGQANVSADQDFSLEAAEAALRSEGYNARIADAAPPAGVLRRGIEALAAIVAIVAAAWIARRFIHLPPGVSVSENMTLGLVFVIGLVASVSSCMAITGGLLLALAAKYNESIAGGSATQRFLPHLSFNAGRIAGYAGFGALTGLAGSALMLSPEVTAMVTIAASLLMLAIGLQMLGLVPPLTSMLRLPNSLQHRVHDLVASQSTAAAFVLGAATFFLPCGFTLALQLYVLAQGSPSRGALTMLVFALGTLPALLSLSMLSSFVTGRVQAYFLKLAGAAVIVLGFLNIQYGLVQTGGNYSPATSFGDARAETGTVQARQVQVVEMTVIGLEYRPNRFTVKAGIPVEWRIDGREAEGCGRILVARGIGLTKFLRADKPDVVTFTPQRPGEIAFNCSMGMMSPNSGFTVVN